MRGSKKKTFKDFLPDLLASDLLLWDFKTSSPSSRAIHSGKGACFVSKCTGRMAHLLD